MALVGHALSVFGGDLTEKPCFTGKRFSKKVIHKVNFAKDSKDTITSYQVYFALSQQLIGDNDQEHYLGVIEVSGYRHNVGTSFHRV